MVKSIEKDLTKRLKLLFDSQNLTLTCYKIEDFLSFLDSNYIIQPKFNKWKISKDAERLLG